MPGAIYLAEQNKNPFNSLLALYIAAKLPNGLVVKLAGKAEAEPEHRPADHHLQQQPPAALRRPPRQLLRRRQGSLRTPHSCGTFTTNADLVPWARPEVADAERSASFEITQGAGGGACVAATARPPTHPSFSAGTVDPTAGAYTPFVLKLARADGTQPIKGIETTLPKGLVGKLAGIPYCSEAAWPLPPARAARPSRPLPPVPPPPR